MRFVFENKVSAEWRMDWGSKTGCEETIWRIQWSIRWENAGSLDQDSGRGAGEKWMYLREILKVRIKRMGS